MSSEDIHLCLCLCTCAPCLTLINELIAIKEKSLLEWHLVTDLIYALYYNLMPYFQVI